MTRFPFLYDTVLRVTNCEYTFRSMTSRYSLEFSDSALTWGTASSRCRRQHSSARLASIEDGEELKTITFGVREALNGRENCSTPCYVMISGKSDGPENTTISDHNLQSVDLRGTCVLYIYTLKL